MESMLGDFNTYVTYVTYVTYNIYDERPGSNQNNQHTAHGGYTLTELLDARHSEDSNEWISSGLNDDLHPLPGLNSKLGGVLNDWIWQTCGGETAMAQWLNHPEVQKAFACAVFINFLLIFTVLRLFYDCFTTVFDEFLCDCFDDQHEIPLHRRRSTAGVQEAGREVPHADLLR